MLEKSNIQDNEVVELDSINPITTRTSDKSERIDNTSFVILEKKAQEKRKDLLHKVTHFLAGIIIIPFVFMSVLGQKVSPEFSTIVSVVIGFYFGKSLFSNN